MEQLNIFKKSNIVVAEEWCLFTDGASRNNPGPAGAGIYILQNGEVVLGKGFFLGKKSNNQAEYIALLLGLYFIKKLIKKTYLLYIFADSELMVKQIKGEYKVKNPVIKILHSLIVKELIGMDYVLRHVMREENKEADKLANLGIDKKISLPKDFLNEENKSVLGIDE